MPRLKPFSRESVRGCLTYVGVFCIFLIAGLVVVGDWNRDVVDPSARGYSHYIESRGFPLPWLITEKLPELDLGIHDRILYWAIAVNWLLYVLLVGIPWVIVAQLVRIVRRPAEKRLERFMRERSG